MEKQALAQRGGRSKSGKEMLQELVPNADSGGGPFPPHGYFYFAPNDFGHTMKAEMLQGEIGLHPLNR